MTHSFEGLIDFQDVFAKELTVKEGGDDKDDALVFSEKDGPPTKSKTRTSPRRKKAITGLPDENYDSESFAGVQGIGLDKSKGEECRHSPSRNHDHDCITKYTPYIYSFSF